MIRGTRQNAAYVAAKNGQDLSKFSREELCEAHTYARETGAGLDHCAWNYTEHNREGRGRKIRKSANAVRRIGYLLLQEIIRRDVR
jgi:hypothetical protein